MDEQIIRVVGHDHGVTGGIPSFVNTGLWVCAHIPFMYVCLGPAAVFLCCVFWLGCYVGLSYFLWLILKDYPSLAHLAEKLREKNIQTIFAVTEDVVPLYEVGAADLSSTSDTLVKKFKFR